MATAAETLITRLSSRRWFARFEGQISTPAERLVLVFVAYLIGGLGYLVINRLVGNGPFHHLGLSLDERIPFLPGFVFGYVLVYFTPAFAALFIRDRAEFYRTFLAFGLNAAICFPIFLLVPVEYPRLHSIPATFSGHVLALVQSLDRPVNCFPSHHISTAFSTYFAVRRQTRPWGTIFGIAASLVAISTLFVKQHFLVDVPAGIGIAYLTYLISFPREQPAKR